MSYRIPTVYAGADVMVSLTDDYGTVIMTATVRASARDEPVTYVERKDEATGQHWLLTSDGKVTDQNTMLVKQAFQVIELPRVTSDPPPSPTFKTMGVDPLGPDPFGLHEIEEARKLAEKILPGIPTLTHEEAASEFTRLVAFPEEEARFSSEHKRKAIEKMAGVTAPETPPTPLRSKTGAEPTYTPESRVGKLKYPDGTVVTFLGNTGHFACSCPKFRKDGGCCEHIKNCIVKGDDAQFVPYAYGEKIPLVLPMYWEQPNWLFAKVYLIPTTRRTSYVAMLHTFRIHKDTSSEACALCNVDDSIQDKTWGPDFFVENSVKLGTMRSGEGRMGLIYTLSEQLKFAVKHELYDCTQKSHRDLPQARVQEVAARKAGPNSPEMLRWMWFCMTAAMCPFCWKAKLEASTMKFDSLDIK